MSPSLDGVNIRVINKPDSRLVRGKEGLFSCWLEPFILPIVKLEDIYCIESFSQSC